MWPGSLAFVVAVVAVEAARRASLRWGWLDRPNQRSSHVRPTPRIGGIGVVVAWAIALVAVHGWHWGLFGWLLGGAGAMAIVGLVDDVVGLATLPRLALHIAVAASVVVGTDIVAPTGGPHVVAGALAVVWIAWSTNLYNFMDGSDGLAAGQGVIALLAYARMFGGGIDPIAIAGVGALCGFLMHNTSPARVFMGDALSTSLGFLFGVLALFYAQYSVWPAVLPFYVFVFDATATLVRRAVKREKWWSAHKTHAYQLLIQMGWSHRAVQMLYMALAVCTAELAVAWRKLDGSERVIALVVTNAVLALGLAWIWRRSRSLASPPQS